MMEARSLVLEALRAVMRAAGYGALLGFFVAALLLPGVVLAQVGSDGQWASLDDAPVNGFGEPIQPAWVTTGGAFVVCATGTGECTPLKDPYAYSFGQIGGFWWEHYDCPEGYCFSLDGGVKLFACGNACLSQGDLAGYEAASVIPDPPPDEPPPETGDLAGLLAAAEAAASAADAAAGAAGEASRLLFGLLGAGLAALAFFGYSVGVRDA